MRAAETAGTGSVDQQDAFRQQWARQADLHARQRTFAPFAAPQVAVFGDPPRHVAQLDRLTVHRTLGDEGHRRDGTRGGAEDRQHRGGDVVVDGAQVGTDEGVHE